MLCKIEDAADGFLMKQSYTDNENLIVIYMITPCVLLQGEFHLVCWKKISFLVHFGNLYNKTELHISV